MCANTARCGTFSAMEPTMNWDLTSYFPAFGGAEMRAFKQTLTGDLAALQARGDAATPSIFESRLFIL